MLVVLLDSDTTSHQQVTPMCLGVKSDMACIFSLVCALIMEMCNACLLGVCNADIMGIVREVLYCIIQLYRTYILPHRGSVVPWLESKVCV